MTYAAWGYVLGIIFITLTAISSVYTMRFRMDKFFHSHLNKIALVHAVLGSIFVYYLITDFRLPTISDGGLILWNPNVISGWGFGIQMFLYSLLWMYVTFRTLGYIENKWSRAKALVLGFVGFAFGFSSLLYFPGNNVFIMMSASIIMLSTVTFTAIFFWIVRIASKEHLPEVHDIEDIKEIIE
jgi:hypothetical protein